MIKIFEKLKVKKAVLIYPTMGFVGNIMGEFLIDSLKPDLVGYSYTEDNSSVIVSNGHIIYPVNVFYAKDYNFAFIYVSYPFFKNVWKLRDQVDELVKTFSIKELILFEAIVGAPDTLYFSIDTDYENIEKFSRGVINALPATFILKPLSIITSTIFLPNDEKHLAIPNGLAAVKGISILDKLFNLKIDYSSLEKQAIIIEERVKTQISKMKETHDSNLNYVG